MAEIKTQNISLDPRTKRGPSSPPDIPDRGAPGGLSQRIAPSIDMSGSFERLAAAVEKQAESMRVADSLDIQQEISQEFINRQKYFTNQKGTAAKDLPQWHMKDLDKRLEGRIKGQPIKTQNELKQHFNTLHIREGSQLVVHGLTQAEVAKENTKSNLGSMFSQYINNIEDGDPSWSLRVAETADATAESIVKLWPEKDFNVVSKAYREAGTAAYLNRVFVDNPTRGVDIWEDKDTAARLKNVLSTETYTALNKAYNVAKREDTNNNAIAEAMIESKGDMRVAADLILTDKFTEKFFKDRGSDQVTVFNKLRHTAASLEVEDAKKNKARLDTTYQQVWDNTAKRDSKNEIIPGTQNGNAAADALMKLQRNPENNMDFTDTKNVADAWRLDYLRKTTAALPERLTEAFTWISRQIEGGRRLSPTDIMTQFPDIDYRHLSSYNSEVELS